MTRLLQAFLIGTLAVLFAGAGYLFYQWQAGARPPDPVAVGEIVLAASFAGLDDKPQALEQWRGKVLVVNFWATWCAPCREETPVFTAMQDKYGTRGLQIVGLAIDRADQVRDFAREFGINYPLLIVGFKAVEIMRTLGNTAGALPFSVIYDRNGQAILAKLGSFHADDLESKLLPLLDGRGSGPAH